MNLSIIKKYLTPNSLLDIGANKGQFCKLWKETFPKSYVFSIEANKNCEEFLRQVNLNYKICLLYSSKQKIKFFKNKTDLTSTGNSIFREITFHFSDENLIVEEVDADTLDNIVKETSQTFDFIKIDAQGAELEILKGANKTLKTVKGIILEIAHLEYNKNSPLKQEVLKFMDLIGFYKAEVLDEHILDIGSNMKSHHTDELFLRKI